MEQCQVSKENKDQALVCLARTGDRNAFDRLISFLVAPLRGFLRRRVAHQAVDDVLQETLLAAWLGIGRFEQRPQSSFPHWLYQIARHKATDWARSNASQLARETPITTSHEERLSAPDTLQVVEREIDVAGLLQRLSPEQRAIVELRYAYGLTLKEIAQRQNLNLSTVKYHFYRAHELLLQWQEAQEEDR